MDGERLRSMCCDTIVALRPGDPEHRYTCLECLLACTVYEKPGEPAPVRIFIVAPRETTCVEAPPGVEEAYDLMVADHVPAQAAADMAVAASKNGKDPVAWARHFIELRQAVKGGDQRQ